MDSICPSYLCRYQWKLSFLLPPKQQPLSSSSSLLALISHHLATSMLFRMFLDILSFMVGPAFVAFMSLARVFLHSLPLKLLHIFMVMCSLPSCILRRRHSFISSLLLTCHYHFSALSTFCKLLKKFTKPCLIDCKLLSDHLNSYQGARSLTKQEKGFQATDIAFYQKIKAGVIKECQLMTKGYKI